VPAAYSVSVSYGHVVTHSALGAINKACLCIFAAVFVLAVLPLAHAQTFNVLYSFTGDNDAWHAAAPLLDVNGNLYGTTEDGNNTTSCDIGNAPSDGCGTVFEISDGQETLIHVFTGTPDGMKPEGGLIQDEAGNFYGTTLLGGAYGTSDFFGYGTIYKIDTSGNETILYNFAGTPDGSAPIGNLLMDQAGNLYGATEGGGTYGYGTIYELDTSGNESILYNFGTNPNDGSAPQGLVTDGKGNFYGATAYGGNTDYYGIVFKVDSAGQETILYNFLGEGDGGTPYSTPVLDHEGNLYGTTYHGGRFNRSFCSPGCGVIFRVSASGTYTVLHRFKGGTDGSNPQAGLFLSANGKTLYGTTSGLSNTSNSGTIFSYSSAGEQVLFSFPSNGTDGGSPGASLIQDSSGNLYGTTQEQGAFLYGNVFQFIP
jgi:uncharacterized repeat protein (TIGR03803 family)